MAGRVALVGHCSADASYLRLAVVSADQSAQVVVVDGQPELDHLLRLGAADLLLINRQLGYGFSDEAGLELIRKLRTDRSALRLMLVSNYAHVQAEAVALGALPGFGKREIGSPRVTQILRSALAV
jgi:two-component system chemotaxis response regulator CheY